MSATVDSLADASALPVVNAGQKATVCRESSVPVSLEDFATDTFMRT